MEVLSAEVERVLAEALAVHYLSSGGGRNLGQYRTEWRCECGATFVTDGHNGPTLREAAGAHVAAEQAKALAPLLEARAGLAEVEAELARLHAILRSASVNRNGTQ